MLTDLLKWGGKRSEASSRGAEGVPERDEPVVASKAFPKFVATLSQKESPVLLDLGPVIGSNVGFCGERLGCKLFIEDLLADVDRTLRGTAKTDLAASMPTRFSHKDGSIDGILCWDLFDFLDRAAAQALAGEIVRMLRPGGAVMGFFCTSAVERAPFTKFEIVDDKTLRHRSHPGVGGKKVSLPNREILRMFEGLVVADSFLLKNNIREMLLRKKIVAASSESEEPAAAAATPAKT